jgi:hypothetical protein
MVYYVAGRRQVTELMHEAEQSKALELDDVGQGVGKTLAMPQL